MNRKLGQKLLGTVNTVHTCHDQHLPKMAKNMYYYRMNHSDYHTMNMSVYRLESTPPPPVVINCNDFCSSKPEAVMKMRNIHIQHVHHR